ncbi:TIGR02677 family protein [Paenibacillus kribbensis]|uniref:TIGR02677 family protein n=1 Tax=Paenibacillus kribbensis TaxID=172713 RepID=UPI000837BDB8|nr:TIGR02677 family protein [Paenibacillus kribbensis]
MDKIPNLQSLRGITELKYVNAENVTRYRAIMRYVYQQYQKLNYWLKPEQIYEGLLEWDLHKNYTLEQCQIDLTQLAEWGNLTAQHDGERAVTVEEYLRKKFRYLLTPYSIEIERMLESLESIRGYGGSLEPTLFDTISDTLFKIRENAGEYEPAKALEYWRLLFSSFQTLHEASVDYIASLQTGMAEDLMATDSFLLYKDSITHYLQDFIQALQRRSYKIEGNLHQITSGVRDLFLGAVVDDEWRIPKLEQLVTKEQYLNELLDKWNSLSRWFLGDHDSISDSVLLERATKEAIVKVVRSAVRIQERKRSNISRKQDLDYLGKWFYGIQDLDTAHKLSAYVFGLFSARHLQGEDSRESDSKEMSMWKERAIPRTIRPRNRKRSERHDIKAVIDNSTLKEQFRDAFLIKQKQELEFLIRMVDTGSISISEFETIRELTRLQLLAWISRCNASSTNSFQTSEGVKIELSHPPDKERALLHCEDGTLELINYRFRFVVINRKAWTDQVAWFNEL